MAPRPSHTSRKADLLSSPSPDDLSPTPSSSQDSDFQPSPASSSSTPDSDSGCGSGSGSGSGSSEHLFTPSPAQRRSIPEGLAVRSRPFIGQRASTRNMARTKGKKSKEETAGEEDGGRGGGRAWGRARAQKGRGRGGRGGAASAQAATTAAAVNKGQDEEEEEEEVPLGKEPEDVDMGEREDTSSANTSPASATRTSTRYLPLPPSTILDAFFTAHVQRRSEGLGQVCRVPCDLEALLPGIEEHFYCLHVDFHDLTGWTAAWFASQSASLTTQPRLPLPSPPTTTHIAIVTEAEQVKCKGGADARRVELEQQYTASGAAQKEARAAAMKEAAANHLELDFMTVQPLLLGGDQELPLELLWLALTCKESNRAPVNIILLEQHISVTYQHRTSGGLPVAVVEDDSSHAGVHRLQLSSDAADNVVISHLTATMTADPSAPTSSSTSDRRREQHRYWLLVGTDGRVRFKPQDPAIKWLMQEARDDVKQLITQDVLLQRQHAALLDEGGTESDDDTAGGKQAAGSKRRKRKPPSRVKGRTPALHENKRSKKEGDETEETQPTSSADLVGESDHEVDLNPKSSEPCRHFDSCGGPANCDATARRRANGKKGVDRTGHERQAHPYCCLDLWQKKCPALMTRKGTDRSGFKRAIMGAKHAKGPVWDPLPPTGCTTLTPQNDCVQVAPSGESSEGAHVEQRVNEAVERWTRKRAELINNGEATEGQSSPISHGSLVNPPTPVASFGAAGSPFVYSYASPTNPYSYPSHLVYPPPPGATFGGAVPNWSSSLGPSHSHSSLSAGLSAAPTTGPTPAPSAGPSQAANSWPPAGHVVKEGKVVVLEEVDPFWLARPHEVAPILFCNELINYFKKATTASITLFRPNQCLVPTLMPKHLSVTHMDCDFPRNTHPDYFTYYRAPLRQLARQPPTPAVDLDHNDRILKSTPTTRTQQGRERDYCHSVNSRTFDSESTLEAQLYRKDNTHRLWPMHSKPDPGAGVGSETTPVFTEDELAEWVAEQTDSVRGVKSCEVMLRAIKNDDRRENVYDDADNWKMVKKRVEYLEKAAGGPIFDVCADDEHALGEPESKAATGQPLTTAVNEAKWKSMAELDTPHPLNLGRISHFPKSLSSLLPVHGLDFIGGMVAMLYVKHDINGCDFHLHVEQGFLPFVNVAHHGTGLWYSVPPGYEQQLVRYIDDVAKRFELWGDDFILSDVGAGCDKALLFARSVLPDPYELANTTYKIPVQRHEQEPGDIMVGQGYVFHSGTGGSSTVISEAINAAPVWWLKQGLPQLVNMLRDELTPYMKVKKMFDESEQLIPPVRFTLESAKVILSDDVANEFCRLIPVKWFRGFVRVILFHLRAHNASQPPAAYTAALKFKAAQAGIRFQDILTGEQAKRAERLLEELSLWLDDELATEIAAKQL